MLKNIILATALLLGVQPAFSNAPDALADILDFGTGAALLDFSSEYSSDWRAEWSALALLDGTGRLGWCSADGAAFPHEFTIELASEHELTGFTFENSSAQENEYPGISAREVEVLVSTIGPESGFRRVAEGVIERGGRLSLPLAQAARGRWIKIAVHSNWGHGRFTELMEVGATGTPVAIEPTFSLSGVYEDANGGHILRTVIVQDGEDVTGCYSIDGAPLGRLSGRAFGRTAEIEWRQDRDNGAGLQGSWLLVVADEGRQLNGLWYGRGVKAHLTGRWPGRKTAAAPELSCDPDDLAAVIEHAGQATLYGLRFEVDSAQLNDRARPTLQRILALLEAADELRLVVEGHTDAVASEAYNLELSTRRAQAVVGWLVDRGIDASRLKATGKGEAEAVADNSTEQGRRLNRRVEIARLP